MKVELSVIIVNYNGLKYLNDCFDSLIKNLDGIAFEIIVVDNNSQDESCAFIREKYPEIILIESKSNYGFGKGNNEGFKVSQGEYILLINNDTVILDNLVPIISIFKSDLTIGVVGVKMLNENKEYLASAGNFPNISNMLQLKKLLRINKEIISGKCVKSKYEVDWLTGSFLMLPTRIYREIEGFNEDYFMYVEDVDFCKKIADKGYKRIFMPNFSYVHYVGFNKAKNPFLIRGFEIYIENHFKGIYKLFMQSALTINRIVKKAKEKYNLFKMNYF